MLKRTLRKLAVAGTGVGAGLTLLFFAWAWSQGFMPAVGLRNLVAMQFDPDPAPPAHPLTSHPERRITWLADIENRGLAESSGLAASQTVPDVFWSINDSGNSPVVYAFDLSGRDRGQWQVADERAVDWEAMDAFTWNDRPWLVIGDVGDNLRWRKTVRLIVLPEPEPEPEPHRENIQTSEADKVLEVTHELTLTYPEGPRDVEALAFDAPRQRVLLLSKRRHPPEVFAVDWPFTEPSVQAERIAELPHLPRPTAFDKAENPRHWSTRHMPSGMDAAGDRLLITTYKHVYLYDLADLTRAPVLIAMPSAGQREALSFAHERDDVAYVTRERQQGIGVADLYRIELSLRCNEGCEP